MPKPERKHGGRRSGAGRPRQYAHLCAPTSVVLELEQMIRLNHRCGKLKISRTTAIKHAVSEWLERSEDNG